MCVMRGGILDHARWWGILSVLLVAFLLTLPGTAQPRRDAYIPQPSGLHSTLIANGGRFIRDDRFADMMKSFLLPNGQRNASNATFLFQQCFSGGMLDDLDNALKRDLPWIAGAASQHDRPALAEPGGRPRPEGYWTDELFKELRENQTILESLRAARKADEAKRLENPQILHRGQGSDDIKLKKPGATSMHAILWAGNVDPGRPLNQNHVNMIEGMYHRIQRAWRGDRRNVTITVMYGNGTTQVPQAWRNKGWDIREASEAKLQDRLNELRDGNAANGEMNPNEQFLFFGGDHGGRVNERNQPVAVRSMDTYQDVVTLSDGVLDGIHYEPDNQVTLTMEYTGVMAPDIAPVSLNGTTLGFLDPTVSMMEFIVPENIVSLSNLLQVGNQGPTDFVLNRCAFDSGGIDLGAFIVPEPTSLLLLGAGFMGVAYRRRRT